MQTVLNLPTKLVPTIYFLGAVLLWFATATSSSSHASDPKIEASVHRVWRTSEVVDLAAQVNSSTSTGTSTTALRGSGLNIFLVLRLDKGYLNLDMNQIRLRLNRDTWSPTFLYHFQRATATQPIRVDSVQMEAGTPILLLLSFEGAESSLADIKLFIRDKDHGTLSALYDRRQYALQLADQVARQNLEGGRPSFGEPIDLRIPGRVGALSSIKPPEKAIGLRILFILCNVGHVQREGFIVKPEAPIQFIYNEDRPKNCYNQLLQSGITLPAGPTFVALKSTGSVELRFTASGPKFVASPEAWGAVLIHVDGATGHELLPEVQFKNGQFAITGGRLEIAIGTLALIDGKIYKYERAKWQLTK